MVSGKDKKVLVGVVGRLGAGKTSFARRLSEYGGKLLKADEIAWKLYANPTIIKDLKATFSKRIFDLHGRVDRDKLGQIVFSDPVALKRLNAIIHPPLVGELEYLITHFKESVVIIDAALLLDWPLAKKCDLLIAVVADEDLSLSRLAEKRVRQRKARAILAVQRPEEEFRKLCHVVIENDGGLRDLKIKAGKVWREYVQPLIQND